MAWEDLTGTEVSHHHSAVESARFGVDIGRVTVGCDGVHDSGLPARLRQVLTGAAEDVLVTRYPAGAHRVGACLLTSGRTVIPAGALTYWEAPAALLAGSALLWLNPQDDRVLCSRDGLRVQGAAEHQSTAASVTSIVADSFAGYGNHYLANPLLSHEAALAGYTDWALRGLRTGGQDLRLLLHHDRPIGIATLQESRDGSDLEILLAGLVSDTQGRGWYAVLLAAIGHEAIRRGVARVIISTQAHNVRVQRAWARTGLRPFATVETVHVVRPGLLADLPSPR